MDKQFQFGDPPVIETVLSAQFASLPNFTAAHAGCFWQGMLANDSPEWGKATLKENQRLEDVFENLGPEVAFGRLGLQFRSGSEPSRVQIVHPDDERMIQVQDTRFIYNWRKRSQGYPSYKSTRPEFDLLFEKFNAYLQRGGFPLTQPNQWEVVYVNHIGKGSLWDAVREWHRIIGGLYIPDGPDGAEFETMAGLWKYRLSDVRGRLHVSLQHGRTTKGQVLILEFVARGPVDDSKGLTLGAGLSLGHQAIVEAFYKMTSPQAHVEWKEGA